eukprot:3404216-Pyramimonas_sp.AAC.1
MFSKRASGYVYGERSIRQSIRNGRKSMAALVNAGSNLIQSMFKPFGRNKESAMEPDAAAEALGKGMTRADLVILKELGIGMSGVAYLCRLPKHDNRLVVVKIMKKSRLIRMNQVENVMREKTIQASFNNSFVVGY